MENDDNDNDNNDERTNDGWSKAEEATAGGMIGYMLGTLLTATILALNSLQGTAPVSNAAIYIVGALTTGWLITKTAQVGMSEWDERHHDERHHDKQQKRKREL